MQGAHERAHRRAAVRFERVCSEQSWQEAEFQAVARQPLTAIADSMASTVACFCVPVSNGELARMQARRAQGGLMTHRAIEDAVLENAASCAALSGAQRSLWFRYLRHPELKGWFNFSFVIRIEPGLEPLRLRAILDELVRRHAMFRVRLLTLDG